MIKRKQIRIRDPYIVVDNDRYYMYATFGERKLSYYHSKDLENWTYGGTVFTIPDDFWAYKDVWAGEVHRYKGKFYLFVSLLGKNGLRGTQIAVSDTPEGPFIPVTDRAATPEDLSCIDGTLYVQDGVPYIIYSHDWPDNFNEDTLEYVGQICAAQLSDDLVSIVGEPWVLFDSNESPISKATPHHIEKFLRYGSDAPFVQRLSDGGLFLTWSPYLDNNYVVLSAVSKSGDIRGPWEHCDKALYDNNGGHAMFFNSLEGKLCMALHGPEIQDLERAHIFEIFENNGKLEISREI